MNCTVPQASSCETSFCVPSVSDGLCILDPVYTPRWCNFAAYPSDKMGKLAGKDSQGYNCNAGSRDCSCLRNGTAETTWCTLGLECREDDDGKMRCLASSTPLQWTNSAETRAANIMAWLLVAATAALN